MGNRFHQVPSLAPNIVSSCPRKDCTENNNCSLGPPTAQEYFIVRLARHLLESGAVSPITIHDNILIFGRDVEEHNINLRATLTRAKANGVTLKLSKSSICSTEVKRFGRVFSAVECQQTQTRSSKNEDCRSPFQAATYNARFTFDHKVGESYEEVTAPLR